MPIAIPTEEEAIAIAAQVTRELRDDASWVSANKVWPVVTVRDEYAEQPESPATLSVSAKPSIAEVRLGLTTIDRYPHWHGVIYEVTLNHEGSVLYAEIDSAVMIPDGRTVSSHRTTPTVRIVKGELMFEGGVRPEEAAMFEFQTALGFRLLERIG